MAVTAKRAAELLNTSYNTYKEWKGERRNMTGPSIRLIEVLIDIKGTGFGKKFGV
jgi:DNA-binding transcriptional regulator YiaG